MKNYSISEVFLSKQGEGVNTGQTAIFVRFGGCNLKCELKKTELSPGGFNCDTDFMSITKTPFDELKRNIEDLVFKAVDKFAERPIWIIFTGGEPMLQLDNQLVDFCKQYCKTAIETNGTFNCDHLGLDWITISPKVAEHCIKQLSANEVKYVRGETQPLPRTLVKADHYLISPAFEGLTLTEETLKWCQEIIKDTKWKLSLQQHKLINIR